MKLYTFFILIFSAVFICNSCSYPKIRTKNQLDTLSELSCYQNQPLEKFLRNLKLEIKSVYYRTAGESNPNGITLRFDSRKEFSKLRSENILPARIYIHFNSDEQTLKIISNLGDDRIFEKETEINMFLDKIKKLKVFRISGSSEREMEKPIKG